MLNLEKFRKKLESIDSDKFEVAPSDQANVLGGCPAIFIVYTRADGSRGNYNEAGKIDLEIRDTYCTWE